MTTSTSFRLFSLIFYICVVFFAGAASVHAQNISTVAGSATAGFAGDNAAATSARLSNPTGVTVDSAGNLYIADLNNHRIRKVTVATGIITTVAGTGVAGFSGDGAAATAAQLSAPSRVAVDSAGNLYIADAINNRIRKVTAATGFISTIAGTGVNGFSGDGGAATSAQIGNARGVTVDSAGNIYVADNDNNRIRKIDALSGIITTVAGNGAATFSGDGGLATAAGIGSNAFEAAVDSAGNIFFVSQTTNRIRRVSAATGIITTVAGTGAAGFSGDNGAATAAQVSGPIGVATDSAGNVYVADLNNSRIRKITVATGIITTLAGTGVAGFSGDGAAAVSAQLSQPYGVGVDSVGNIYVAELGNSRIRKISAPAAALPPPPPTAPTNLVCTSTGAADINCRYNLSTTTSTNPIQSYRLYCANDTASIAVQTTVASTESAATISNAPIGRYTCNVTAQATTSASDLSNLALLVLQRTPLSLSTQFSTDGTGFGSILVRSNSTPLSSLIGRFDGTKFNFTPTTDLGSQWSTLGVGDIVGRNRSSVISRNQSGDVRVDTDTGSLPANTTLRKAQQDWMLESVIDLDGDGKADLVWRYMKPGSNDSGVIFAWFSAGNDAASVNVGEVVYRGGAPLTWSLIGGMDIDGDGKGDLIWLNPTNEIRSLTSTSRRAWKNERIGALPAGYSIQKLSDFNADGKGDILFKDSAGRVKLWLLDGTRIATDVDMPSVAASTTFFAAGDFDGDGTIDIVWRKADGTLTVWLMNKSVINQPTVIDNAGVAPAGVVVE
jgi:sugar lactone lactonase YvrE